MMRPVPTKEQAKAANYMIRFGEEWFDETANADRMNATTSSVPTTITVITRDL